MEKIIRIKRGIVLIATLIILLGCGKANNAKWLVAEIEVRDELTDELIDADLELHYQYKGQNEWQVEEIGSTTDGTFYLEKKFSNKVNKARVFAYGTDAYHSEGTFQKWNDNGVQYDFIDPKSKSEIVIYLDPIYRMELTFENTGCFDNTDTLRLYVQDPDTNNHAFLDNFTDTLVGCYYGSPAGVPSWSTKPYVGYVGYLKRNGVNTEVLTYPTLEPFVVNQILIEY